MKKFNTLLFTLFLIGFSFAQKNYGINSSQEKILNAENDAIPKIIHSQPINYSTIVLLNDKYTSLETLNILNPESIKSMKVEKGGFEVDNQNYSGKIVVITKPEFKSSFLTIDELVKKYANLNTQENYICSIDGKIMNADKNNTLLDEKNIVQIKIVELNKIDTPTNMNLIEILTKNKKGSSNKSGIILRGSEIALNN